MPGPRPQGQHRVQIRDALRSLREFYAAQLAEWDDPVRLLDDADH